MRAPWLISSFASIVNYPQGVTSGCAPCRRGQLIVCPFRSANSTIFCRIQLPTYTSISTADSPASSRQYYTAIYFSAQSAFPTPI
jgi:hypothetical protein